MDGCGSETQNVNSPSTSASVFSLRVSKLEKPLVTLREGRPKYQGERSPLVCGRPFIRNVRSSPKEVSPPHYNSSISDRPWHLRYFRLCKIGSRTVDVVPFWSLCQATSLRYFYVLCFFLSFPFVSLSAFLYKYFSSKHAQGFPWDQTKTESSSCIVHIFECTFQSTQDPRDSPDWNCVGYGCLSYVRR